VHVPDFRNQLGAEALRTEDDARVCAGKAIHFVAFLAAESRTPIQQRFTRA
jgi:hypothetical protein